MTRSRQNSLGVIAVCSLLVFSGPAAAHSWVERLMRIAPNGTMINPPGYISGYVGRGPGFSDTFDTNLIPPNGRPTGNEILPTDNICKSTQTIGNYSSQFPMLIASPGDYVALQHQENGHVTLPQNQKSKPLNRGTIYIYGTTQPSNDDTLLAIHNVWNANGTGGDGRGKLIATRDFDDGKCYQINSGNISEARQKEFPKPSQSPMGTDLWCQADIQLPEDLEANSTYTIYWLWEWNTYADASTPASRRGLEEEEDDPNSDFNLWLRGELEAAPPSAVITLNETYTSCMQIQMVDPCSDELGDVKGPNCASTSGSGKYANSYIEDQNPNNAAIQSQLLSQFAVAVPGGGSGAAASSGAPAAVASSAAPTVTAQPAAAHEAGVVVTLTVTEDVATVYVTDTVGVTATVFDRGVPAETARPAVAPFLKRAIRRGAGEWQIGGQP